MMTSSMIFFVITKQLFLKTAMITTKKHFAFIYKHQIYYYYYYF